MAVVADTSPIDYLVLIAQIDLLKQLYARILIPPAKKAEVHIECFREMLLGAR
jgi:predicted nucleic acid-binding protein